MWTSSSALFFASLLLTESCSSTPIQARAPIEDGTWEYLAPIAYAPRTEETTVSTSSSEIFILGGLLPFVSGQTFDPTTNIVQSYSIPDNTWKNASSLPTPMNHANAAVVDGKIYVLGGLAPYPGGAWPPPITWPAIGDCWLYDPSVDTWSRLPTNLTTFRGSAGMGVHGTTIYLAGGLSTGTGPTLSTSSSYDTMSGVWTDLPDLPEARDHASAAVVGDTFYIIAGRIDGIPDVRDTVFALDLNNIASGWTTKTSMPTARGGVSTGVYGTRVYVFGGEGNAAATNGVFNNTEVYDAETDTWTELAPMELPRHGTSAVAVEGKIYIPGGGLVSGGTNDPVTTFDVFTP